MHSAELHHNRTGTPGQVRVRMPTPAQIALGSAAGGEAEVELHVELGRAVLSPAEEAVLREGAVIPLDKLADDPVDIVVEGRLIARGEVLVLNEKLCVRIAEVIGSVSALEGSSDAVLA